MEQEVKVSIICNTYNHKNYIEKAINSFLMQKTDFKFEILIHDDASTDGTSDIVRRYADAYPDIIKPIIQTENQFSKHIAILTKYQYPRAKGKYLAICEGDDFWIDEYKLQKQVDFLESHQEYIACVHRYIVVDENGTEQYIRTFGYYDEAEAGKYTISDFDNTYLPSQLASLMMRNIICDKENGYPESFVNIGVQGDIKIFLYLLAHGYIYRMSDIMSAYRFVQIEGGNSWSSRMIGKKISYKQWLELRKLDKAFVAEYRKPSNLRTREISAAIGAMRETKKSHNWIELYRFPIMLLKQRGLLGAIMKLAINRGN